MQRRADEAASHPGMTMKALGTIIPTIRAALAMHFPGRKQRRLDVSLPRAFVGKTQVIDFTGRRREIRTPDPLGVNEML
jgi:hypothetical protein